MTQTTEPTQATFSFYSSLEQDFFYHENLAKQKGIKHIAGIGLDGTTCLAGPIVVAIVTASNGLLFSEIKNIKTLTDAQLRACYQKILLTPGISYSVEVIEPETIDEIGILQAISVAMENLVRSLSKTPEFLLIEGTFSPFGSNISSAIFKGEQFSSTIGCAHILAKATRNAIMEGIDANCPEYGFAQNKGLPTKEHIKNIKQFGLSSLHRKSQTDLLKISKSSPLLKEGLSVPDEFLQF